MKKAKVLLFDLYGTLLKFSSSSLVREVSELLEAPRGIVAANILRRELYCLSVDKKEIFYDLLNLLNIPIQKKNNYQLACAHILDKHLESISVFDSALGILSFLKARGYRLGLVSNLASPFKEPVYKFSLNKFFDVMMFSCDCAIAKPNPAIYEMTCKALKVKPEKCTFIGDSAVNDCLAPISVGMKALLIDGNNSSTHPSISNISDLAWLDIDSGRLLLHKGKRLTLDNTHHYIQSLFTLQDNCLGRYNIVGKLELRSSSPTGDLTVHYVKRFSQKGSASTEKLAYDIHGLVGLSSCKAHIIKEREPLLITSAVSGAKWEKQHARKFLPELGWHFAMAYIFANADFRPRNIIIEEKAGIQSLRVIDFEHCFFSLALDVTHLKDPDNPETFNTMSAEDITLRTKRKVLSIEHCRRVLKEFIPQVNDMEFSEFRKGWFALYSDVRKQLGTIESMLRTSIKVKPYPIIGTHSYRRAMSSIDVDAILSRVSENEDIVCQGLRPLTEEQL
ncbi:hypothetical protein AWM79_15845 [Pseudomonas agarici]|uniref:HAD family hydrolase n=1 Tax=Pseudomonas agarici TaxID=46677 RepID=A0A0X1T3P4_PSEAA|nr:HAD family hydrolase [Pseudomonas agarici]AMB86694.1 hypothetical protein AWM79_15845 [Pseudomonas agarici]